MFLEFDVMFLDFYCCFGSVTSPTVSDAREKKIICCSERDLLLIYRIRIEKRKRRGMDRNKWNNPAGSNGFRIFVIF